MISQTAEYALRATVYLAITDGSPKTTSQISAATKVPQAYLAKVLQGLAAKGLVTMKRGVGGGVRLSRPADQLTIFDIVEAIAPIERMTTCPIGSTEGAFCALHDRLNQAVGHVEAAYRATTLAELCDPSNSLPPLCSEKKEAVAQLQA